jgi:Cu/Ag efflux pump CusA
MPNFGLTLFFGVAFAAAFDVAFAAAFGVAFAAAFGVAFAAAFGVAFAFGVALVAAHAEGPKSATDQTRRIEENMRIRECECIGTTKRIQYEILVRTVLQLAE